MYKDITEDQIQEWKAKYGNLRKITIKNEDGEFKFIVCKPNRSVSLALEKSSKKQDLEGASKVLISNCVLGGDLQAMEQDAGVYIGLIESITGLIQNNEKSIKKI